MPDTELAKDTTEVVTDNTPTDKVEDTTPPEGDKEPVQKVEDVQDDKTKEAGAPENYEDFTFPEGVEADKELIEAFRPLAKELNLTQDQAQKLVDIQAKAAQKMATAQQEAFETVTNEWKEAAQKDTEIGGANFDANVATAREAMKAFGNDALREMLDMTGAGNHPEVIRFFYKVGKAISEDKMNMGGGANNVPKDHASILYPTMSN